MKPFISAFINDIQNEDIYRFLEKSYTNIEVIERHYRGYVNVRFSNGKEEFFLHLIENYTPYDFRKSGFVGVKLDIVPEGSASDFVSDILSSFGGYLSTDEQNRIWTYIVNIADDNAQKEKRNISLLEKIYEVFKIS